MIGNREVQQFMDDDVIPEPLVEQEAHLLRIGRSPSQLMSTSSLSAQR